MWVGIYLDAHTSLTIFELLCFCFFTTLMKCVDLCTQVVYLCMTVLVSVFLFVTTIACFDLFAFLLNDFGHSFFAFHWHAVNRWRVEWFASLFVVLGFTRQTYLLLYNHKTERGILSYL